MAWNTNSARSKNWGTEILTDADLEAQLDLLHTWNNDSMNGTTGHGHTGGTNDGKPIVLTTAVTGILPVANGGTGSATVSTVNLTGDQTVAGIKTFSSAIVSNLTGNVTGNLTGNVTGTVSNQLGAWASKSATTIYQAATDGFVNAFVQNANNNSALKGYTDSAASPTTLRAASSSSSGASGSSYVSIFFPVKKNDYYQVTYGTADSFTMYFIPIGS